MSKRGHNWNCWCDGCAGIFSRPNRRAKIQRAPRKVRISPHVHNFVRKGDFIACPCGVYARIGTVSAPAPQPSLDFSTDLEVSGKAPKYSAEACASKLRKV